MNMPPQDRERISTAIHGAEARTSGEIVCVLAQTSCDVGQILTRVNRMLTADTDDFHFVTLFFARLDPRRRELVYGAAGQRSYLLHASGSVTVLDSTSLPLGVDADMIVPAAPPIVLQTGDVVALFTDGVVETESINRTRFGVGRALEVIRSHRDEPAAQIVETLHQALDVFSLHQPRSDDCTILVVRVVEPPAEGA